MKSTITESFKTTMVESFINTIKDSDSYYLLIYSESNQPLFAVKINPDDIIQGIKNNRITFDKIIPYNKDTPNLYAQPFWGTSETLYQHSVYKLIGSVSDELASSLPTQTTPEPIRTSDGNIWKFMYDIPPTLAYKFSTKYYVPVVDTQSIYSDETTTSQQPPNGHGFSILYELPATSIIINSKIHGTLFDKTLTYKALSIIKVESENKPDFIFTSIRAIPTNSQSPLNPGDEFTISEAGLTLNAKVESKLKDGSLIISGDDLIIELIDRNEYKFSHGNYRLVKPTIEPELITQITIDNNKIKTIEGKTKQTIITVIDF